jgi:ribulose-bisphosphate carboxylase large chain
LEICYSRYNGKRNNETKTGFEVVEMKGGYINLNYEPSKDDLICEFRIEPEKGFTIKEAAEKIASESSVGTWTEVKTMKPRIKSLAAKIFEVRENWVKIAYPIDLFELGNMPQILSSIAGNIFGMKAVRNLRLEDIHWPYKLMKSFKGPFFGIQGVRKLIKVKNRPLTGTIVKPKLGLNEKEHAKVAHEAWIGGIDIVKDDENLSNMKFNKFGKRVIETLKMRDRAEIETGERKMYMPNVTAETNEMIRRANFVKEHGGEYVMIDIMTAGWSGLQTLRNEDLKLVLHAHRAGHAALTRNKRHGISMLVIADIARLIGVDQLHIGTVIGKMEGTGEEVLAIGEEIEKKIIKEHGHVLSEDWHHIKPIFAVASGGLHPRLVPYLIERLGKDVVLQFGGGIHGLGTYTGAMAVRQAVEATTQNIPLKEYARTHKELDAALKKWR